MLLPFDFFPICPERAEASYMKAFALTGRLRYITIIPRVLPWARSFCPFRAYWIEFPYFPVVSSFTAR